MPDSQLLEFFDSPSETTFIIEHVNEEFTSVLSLIHISEPTRPY